MPAEDASAEPLRGPIASFKLTEPAQTKISRPAVSTKFGEICEQWTKSFAKDCAAKAEPWMERIGSALGSLAKTITGNHSDTDSSLGFKLDHAADFLKRVDQALHQKDGPFSDEKHFIWKHRHLGELMRTSAPSQRENFADVSELNALATEYISTPWLRDPYLDWLLIDALAGASIIGSLELYMQQKHGMSYAIDAVSWKMFLWRLIMWPIAFAVGWVLPAIGCYYLAMVWSVPAGIGIGVLYYGFTLLGLIRWTWLRLSHLLPGRPTPHQRLFRVVEAAERAYEVLTGPVLHVGTVHRAFAQAAAEGVNWNHQIFYILDRLEAEPPALWENWVRRSGVEVSSSEFA